jgi:CBS domain-containing protein
MSGPIPTEAAPLALRARTARELRTPFPLAVRATATVGDALRLLTDYGIGGAPVVDEAGRPVGVVSESDLLTCEREEADRTGPPLDFFGRRDLAPARRPGDAATAAAADRPVREVMTPVVYGVAPDAPAGEVVERMRTLNVHRLFVMGADGRLAGVVSMSDVVAHLGPR